jgi:sulfite reductase beta subunit-like hemoprotein
VVYLTVATVVMLQDVGISDVQKLNVVLVVVVLLSLCREEVPQDVTNNSELNPIALVVIDLAESLVGFERKLGTRRSDDVNNLTIVVFRVTVTVFKSQVTQEVKKSNYPLMRFAEVPVESQFDLLYRLWACDHVKPN